MGTLHTCTGRPGAAEDFHRRALAVHRETRDLQGQASALNGLAEAAQAACAAAAALDRHTSAYEVSAGIGNRYEQARALRGMGRAHQARGEGSSARRRYTEALDLYTEIGLPCADAVLERLAALGPDPDPGATPS